LPWHLVDSITFALAHLPRSSRVALKNLLSVSP